MAPILASVRDAQVAARTASGEETSMTMNTPKAANQAVIRSDAQQTRNASPNRSVKISPPPTLNSATCAGTPSALNVQDTKKEPARSVISVETPKAQLTVPAVRAIHDLATKSVRTCVRAVQTIALLVQVVASTTIAPVQYVWTTNSMEHQMSPIRFALMPVQLVTMTIADASFL